MEKEKYGSQNPECVNTGTSVEKLTDTVCHNVTKVTSFTEISKDIWEATRLQRMLKKHKENFPQFQEKVRELESKLNQQEESVTKHEAWQIRELIQFSELFEELLQKTPEIEIPENENTRRNILILGQEHYVKFSESSDIYTKGSQYDVAHSQQLIDIYQEYFLLDNIAIGHELIGKMYDENQDDKGGLYAVNYDMQLWRIFLLQGWIDEDFVANVVEDRKMIEKMFHAFGMITFFGKTYLKKDDEIFFKNIVTLKYFLHKKRYAEEDFASISNYSDYRFRTFGQKKRINIEAILRHQYDDINFWDDCIDYYANKNLFVRSSLPESIQEDFDINFGQKGLGYFIENSFMDFWKKYVTPGTEFFEEVRQFIQKIPYKTEEDDNILSFLHFFSLRHELESGISTLEKAYKISMSMDIIISDLKKLDFSYGRIIPFCQYIIEKMSDYAVLEFRERNTIENIDKYFPKQQKLVPIIFGAGHSKNWKKHIEEHNEKNPDNQYSLSVLDLV